MSGVWGLGSLGKLWHVPHVAEEVTPLVSSLNHHLQPSSRHHPDIILQCSYLGLIITLQRHHWLLVARSGLEGRQRYRVSGLWLRQVPGTSEASKRLHRPHSRSHFHFKLLLPLKAWRHHQGMISSRSFLDLHCRPFSSPLTSASGVDRCQTSNLYIIIMNTLFLLTLLFHPHPRALRGHYLPTSWLESVLLSWLAS